MSVAREDTTLRARGKEQSLRWTIFVLGLRDREDAVKNGVEKGAGVLRDMVRDGVWGVLRRALRVYKERIYHNSKATECNNCATNS